MAKEPELPSDPIAHLRRVLAGFKRATGIELDRTQVKLSTSKLKRFSKLFPCVKDRLVLVKVAESDSDSSCSLMNQP